MKYICSICDSKFTSKRNLKLHEKIDCGDKELRTISSLYVHTKLVHEGKRYECHICQYSANFKSSSSSQAKRNIFSKYINVRCVTMEHHKEQIYQDMLKLCNKTIIRCSLAQHIILHKEKQIQHKCKICSFQTIHICSLNKHFTNLHKRTKTIEEGNPNGTECLELKSELNIETTLENGDEIKGEYFEPEEMIKTEIKSENCFTNSTAVF